tara:strand:+ start:2231 stop:2962 length:732 start_codon:yes stop_codon:yes gene_type:complete
MAQFKWNEENTATLTSAVTEGVQVSQAELHTIAGDLGTTARSVGSKLRKLGYDVQLASEVNKVGWDPEDQAELEAFLVANSGAFTYAEIATKVAGGKFTTKQVQGKILSMELTGDVKPAEKVVAARTYSAEEEAKLISLVESGASMEDVTEAMGRSIEKVRGKCLSLLKEGRIDAIPTQTTSSAKAKEDILAGIDYAGMTVAEIAIAANRSERGVKALLTRRKLNCADHNGADRAAKIAEKKA